MYLANSFTNCFPRRIGAFSIDGKTRRREFPPKEGKFLFKRAPAGTWVPSTRFLISFALKRFREKTLFLRKGERLEVISLEYASPMSFYAFLSPFEGRGRWMIFLSLFGSVFELENWSWKSKRKLWTGAHFLSLSLFRERDYIIIVNTRAKLGLSFEDVVESLENEEDFKMEIKWNTWME